MHSWVDNTEMYLKVTAQNVV